MTRQEIYDRLASEPDVVVQNEDQLRVKCFLCGDSKKNPNKKRLGIKFNIHDPDKPIQYNCFNCFEHGAFTVEMLHQMDIYDNEIESSIRRINKQCHSDDGKHINKYNNTKEIPISFPSLTNDSKTLSKIKYLYSRIGYKIPITDFENLKIIFNLNDFLRHNNIPVSSVNYKKRVMLDNDYVGWLSVNNEYAIMRDITNSHYLRYVKYNLYNVENNSCGFYAMRNQLDIMTDEDIHIIITEGPLDILGVRYNVLDNNIHNCICIASCNGSFIGAIKYYIKKGLVGDNIIIDCYQDNDTRLNFKSIRSELLPFISPDNFNVYYNTKNKDFGVPKKLIERDKLII